MVTQSSNCCILWLLKVSNEGTGSSLGVLVAELESTEDSSGEDQCVDTDDKVEWGEVFDKENISTTGVEQAESSIDVLGTEYWSSMSGLNLFTSCVLLGSGS